MCSETITTVLVGRACSSLYSPPAVPYRRCPAPHWSIQQEVDTFNWFKVSFRGENGIRSGKVTKKPTGNLNDRLKNRITSGGYHFPSSPCTSFQHMCTKYKVIVTEDVIPKLEKECPCAQSGKRRREKNRFVYKIKKITEGDIKMVGRYVGPGPSFYKVIEISKPHKHSSPTLYHPHIYQRPCILETLISVRGTNLRILWSRRHAGTRV